MNAQVIGGIAAIALGIAAHVLYARVARTRWGYRDLTALGVIGKRVATQSTWTEQDRTLEFALFVAKRVGFILVIVGAAVIYNSHG